MNYLIKMMIIQDSRKINSIESNIKKSILSKYEIRYENKIFFTNDLKKAKRVKREINSSIFFQAKIYQKIQGKYLPLFTTSKRTRKDISEILSLTTLLIENKKKEGMCQFME